MQTTKTPVFVLWTFCFKIVVVIKKIIKQNNLQSYLQNNYYDNKSSNIIGKKPHPKTNKCLVANSR